MADRDPESTPKPLFHDVIFTVISSSELPDNERRELIVMLERDGARYIQPKLSTGRIAALEGLTHIISVTADFPEYEDAINNYIHVVRPRWVQQSLEKGKQSNPRQFSPDQNLIFGDVVIACADIPDGDKEAIAGGVLAMGGQFTSALSKMVTHLLALSENDERCQIALQKKFQCTILLPHWFDDCLRLGKRISEAPYLLPNPEILRQHEQPPPPRVSNDILGAVAPHPVELPPTPAATSESPRELNVFQNKAIMLGDDLNLGTNLLRTITDLILAGGGTVVDDLEVAGVYVCHYRDGPAYIRASQAEKEVGNLSWLYHLITFNAWTSPMRRLLHYPVPRNGVPGFENLIISVSNYTGDARLYLENLTKACGAHFTKTMRQTNTHLVTAHTKSEKCDAAREWNVDVVNHLWLEESYAKYKIQNLSVKKYTHFPPRTHLGEVVGRTQLDRTILQSAFFPKINNTAVITTKSTVRGSSNIEKPFSQDSSPYTQAVNNAPNEDGQDQEEEALQEVDNQDVDERRRPTVLQKTKRNRGDDVVQTPALRKFIEAGKENETPGSTGSRGAKSRAMSKLHDAAADIALYDKERKRVGGVTHGRERGGSATTPEPKESGRRKRKSTEMTDEEESEEESEPVGTPVRKGKRTKTDKLPPVGRRMVLTGWSRWIENPKVEQSEKNQLRNLGILITEDTSRVDLLCAKGVARTKKFVCALADAPEVVSHEFLEYCFKHKEVPDPTKYRLQDLEGEKRLGMDLKVSLNQARQNKHHLLKDWQVFCTEGVAGGFSTYEAIVKANGGTCMLYKGRTAMNVSKRKFDDDDLAAESQGQDTGNTLYLLSNNSKPEMALWSKFREMAKAADMVPMIVRTDWLLSVAMQNAIHWDDKWKWTES